MSALRKPSTQEETSAPIEVAKPARLVYRLDDLPEVLGVSRRTIDRERSADRFPQPDLFIGKMPLWRVETIRRWVEGGGR